MARKASSTKKKKDTNITAFIVVAVLIGVALFLIFNQRSTDKPAVKKPILVKPVQPVPTKVVTKPSVPPVPVKPIVKKPVVKEAPVPAGSAGKIAFVLDDWRQAMRNCKYLKEIDAPLDIAILPGLPNTDNIAQCAKSSKKTVMLHLPLQAYHNSDPYPKDYIIKIDMKPAKVEKLVDDIFKKMPYVEGVNNHMGSKATENQNLMKLILRKVKKKNLFFVDSMTAPNHSVCAEIALDLKLPFARRDIFLDNENTREAILEQIDRLATRAREDGSAIAIGHDRELTLQVIKEQIPVLRAKGFKIVSVKELLENQ